MAQALLSKLASAAEFVVLPGAVLVAYFTTSRSTEPKRDRNAKPSDSGNNRNNWSSSSSPPSSSDPVKYDDGKDWGRHGSSKTDGDTYPQMATVLT